MGRRLLPADEAERLIAKYRPQRSRLVWFKHRDWGQSYAQAMCDGCAEIGAVYPDTHFLAIVFLHECAHVIDRAVSVPDWPKHPRHGYEYAAERTAMRWWQNEGYAVPPEYIRVSKAYIRKLVRMDRRKKHPILPHVSRWANTGQRYAFDIEL